MYIECNPNHYETVKEMEKSLIKLELQNQQILDMLKDIYSTIDPAYYNAEEIKELIESATGMSIEEVLK